MKTLKTIAALLPLAVFVGCSTSKVWYQEGRSFQEAQKDLAACREAKAQLPNPAAWNSFGVVIRDTAKRKDYVKDCMMAEGYSLVDKNSLPTGVRGVPQ